MQSITRRAGRRAITRRAIGRATVAALAGFAILRHARGEAPIELRCSLDTAPSHPRNVAFRAFLAAFEAASGGQVKTRLFESGSLYPDLRVATAMMQGQVEMCCPGTWTLTGFVPDIDFTQLPVLYGRTAEMVAKAVDGNAGRFVNRQIANKLHVRVLGGWFNYGFNNWFTTKKPLSSMADLKDMKIRSPGGILISARIRFFGALANVTAWPDVPLAMSQGTFDGLISSDESVNTAKLVDSGMRHALHDDQAMITYVPLLDQAFWSKLDPKLQETLATLWTSHIPAWRETAANAQRLAREVLTQQGVTFVDVPQAERDALRVRMVAGQDKIVADAHMSPELVKLVMADVGI
jgi:TRAP-type C4-dicarboxylate transport system substrate-binding protein